MLTEGKWVSIHNRNAIGFIVEIGYSDVDVYVIQDGKAKGNKKFSHSQLTEIGSVLTLEDQEALKYQYTNMALDTDDRAWLRMLTEAEESK